MPALCHEGRARARLRVRRKRARCNHATAAIAKAVRVDMSPLKGKSATRQAKAKGAKHPQAGCRKEGCLMSVHEEQEEIPALIFFIFMGHLQR